MSTYYKTESIVFNLHCYSCFALYPLTDIYSYLWFVLLTMILDSGMWNITLLSRGCKPRIISEKGDIPTNTAISLRRLFPAWALWNNLYHLSEKKIEIKFLTKTYNVAAEWPELHPRQWPPFWIEIRKHPHTPRQVLWNKMSHCWSSLRDVSVTAIIFVSNLFQILFYRSVIQQP